MIKLLYDDVYGNDKRAINRHHDKKYKDDKTGFIFILSRTTDAKPMFFEAYGPMKEDFDGACPRLKINGKEYWGDGISWKKAYILFEKEVYERLEQK